MAKRILSTLFNKEPVLVAATQLGADSLYLFVDDPINETQQTALDIIQESLGAVIKIYTIKINPYDIVRIAKKTVSLLESFSEEDNVTVNVSSGRKTQALGLLFGSYARAKYVNKVIYVTEEEHKIIDLPKLSFNLTNSQHRLLEKISEKQHSSLIELAERSDMSRGMLYRNLKELQDEGFIDIDKESKYVLTDAGRIARL